MEDDFWTIDPDGVRRGIKKYIIGLENSLSSEIATNGGFPYAKFLMRRLIGYSKQEILIYQRNFPDKLMVEMIPDFKRFLGYGGKLRILYLNFDGYDPSLFEDQLEGDIISAPVRYTENNNNFNPDYYTGLTTNEEKWKYLAQNLKFSIADEIGFQIFDGRGVRVEMGTINGNEFASIYSFNKPETADCWINEFEKHFGLPD